MQSVADMRSFFSFSVFLVCPARPSSCNSFQALLCQLGIFPRAWPHLTNPGAVARRKISRFALAATVASFARGTARRLSPLEYFRKLSPTGAGGSLDLSIRQMFK
jgi:hypothetical protein